MKIIALVAVLTIAACSCTAQSKPAWYFLGGDAFFDASKIRAAKSIRTVVVKNVAAGRPLDAVGSEIEFDCANNRWRTTFIRWIASDGQQVEQRYPNSIFKELEVGPRAGMFDVACGVKSGFASPDAVKLSHKESPEQYYKSTK